MVRQRPPDYIPRAVLARSDLVDACASRDLGLIFRIAKKWSGVGFTVSHLARRCEMTASQVQDYMQRGRQALSIEVFERVADGLHIPGLMLGIGERPWERQDVAVMAGPVGGRNDDLASHPARDRLLRAPWTPDGTLVAAREVSEVRPVDRRSFLLLTSVALMSPAHEWLIAQPVNDVSSPAGRAIGPKVVDQINDITGMLRRMDDQMGGGSLIDVVQAQISYVVRLLREGRYTDSTGRRLHGTVGELLRFGGWVSYDDGDPVQAQRFWVAALHSAHSAGDRALGANVLGFMSEPARDLGRPDDAVKLANTALAGYKGSSPRVSAILNMRAALAHAIKGDATECRRSIDSAYSAFRNSPPQSGEPDWCYWMDDAMLNEQIGTSLMWLGDYSPACNYLESSLRAEQNFQVREGALRLTRLATARARQGEPERACAAGTRAIETLSTQVDSARLIVMIRGLRNDLEPYRRVGVVREFGERVNELAVRGKS